MTAAICVECGAWKVGAWTPCAACRSDPTTDLERARALLLSDHNLARGALEAVQQRILAGQRPSFDERAVAELARQVGATPVWTWKQRIRMLAVLWPIAVMACLLLFVIAVGLLALTGRI
jgi:hypothetical protein